MGCFDTFRYASQCEFICILFYRFSFVYSGIKVLRLKSINSMKKILGLRLLTRAHFILAIPFTLGYMLDWYQQDTLRILGFLLPIQLLFCYLIELCLHRDAETGPSIAR